MSGPQDFKELINQRLPGVNDLTGLIWALSFVLSLKDSYRQGRK